MSTPIKLDKETSIDLLKRYIDAGYKNTGVVSIKEGAIIHKYFRILKNQEKATEETPNEAELFKVIFKVIEVLNTNRAYTLDDAAVLDKIMSYIDETVLKAEKTEEESKEKIKEI